MRYKEFVDNFIEEFRECNKDVTIQIGSDGKEYFICSSVKKVNQFFLTGKTLKDTTNYTHNDVIKLTDRYISVNCCEGADIPELIEYGYSDGLLIVKCSNKTLKIDISSYKNVDIIQLDNGFIISNGSNIYCYTIDGNFNGEAVIGSKYELDNLVYVGGTLEILVSDKNNYEQYKATVNVENATVGKYLYIR